MRFFERLLLPVTLGLIACGSELSQVDHESSLPTAKEIETAVKQVEIQSESNPNNFTTEGKPTKTIETPWGPREVYDPTQDEEVKVAFEKLNANNFSTIQNDYVLTNAMSAYRNALYNYNCLTVVDAFCRVCSVSHEDTKPIKELSPICSVIPPSYMNIGNETIAICYGDSGKYLEYFDGINIQQNKNRSERFKLVLNQTCAVWDNNDL